MKPLNEINFGKTKGLDSMLHAFQARFFMNMSPSAIILAYVDCTCHFLNSPETQLNTFNKFHHSINTLLDDIFSNKDMKQVDARFKGDSWQRFPYSVNYKVFSAVEGFLNRVMADTKGASQHHQELVTFFTRLILQALSPSNYLLINPELIETTMTQRGANLVRGIEHFIEDYTRLFKEKKSMGTKGFKPGVNLAATPGKVVFKNRLMELICYTPTTESVYAEPVLIVPAWIMKYYILDLSQSNSLVRFLVDHGHSVFMISWKNPGKDERELGMNDYLKLGIIEALKTISTLVPDQRIHSVGYCLGGTLLAIAAAWLQGKGDTILKTVTLMAAQTDFTDVGELSLFIDDSQVTWLEDIMKNQGYLKTDQMAGAFRMLRANELVWSDMINKYLKGERIPINDLMAWNADATRMPYTMHSEYLRSLFLQNNLFEGRYKVDGRSIALSNIHVPVFLVATRRDHVAPWRSVYKFFLPSDAKTVTFVLSSGGHNAGIISEPGHPRRNYQIISRQEGEIYIDPTTFVKTTAVINGSWWIPWQQWLSNNSGEKMLPPFKLKNPLTLVDAPGTYVFEQ